MKLDRNAPYGVISGHPRAAYEQGGVLFDASGVSLAPIHKGPLPKVHKDLTIETDELASAKSFLRQILSQGALSKATVFKAAEDNNQSWEHVKQAAVSMNISKFQYKQSETWKLSEEVSA